MTRKLTFLILAMLFAILGPCADVWGQTIPSTSTFTEKTFSQLADGDVVIFASTTNKAMSNATQTTGKPAQVGITVAGSTGSLSITPGSGNLDDIAWTLTAVTNGFTFYQYGSTVNRLCITVTNSNTAAKVTNATSSYTTMCMGELGLNMQFYGATRFLGCYTSGSDWRTYNTEDANNYGNSSTKFYVLNTNSPTCTIDPTSHDFGEITVGENATFDFTVTTANLTENLTLAVSEGFSVSPTTIASTEIEKTVTVTCAPTAVGALDGTLTISGGGLTDDVTATLSATGLCTAPANELSYETPIALTLTGTEVETTLTPIENTGNGGTITYELIEGDDTHAIVDGNTFMAEAVGSYTVRATQDLNGTTCGGTFDIVINVTSTSPTCFVDQTEWDFGNVAIGTTANKTFTVTTANLTGNLTLYMYDGSNFSVSPTTIEQNATETEITVTCTATTAGELEDILTIYGGGLADEVEVVLTAAGAELYTVSFRAVNGTEPAQQQQTAPEAAIILPSIADVDCNVWQFAGWSESEISTEAPTLLAGGNYTPTKNVTLYAVYKKAEASEPTQVPFVFADIAEANNWQNSHAYTSVVIDPVTITANGGGNNGKYYTSDQTWRMYNGGSVTITSTGNNITAVSSNPSKTFTINDGIASLNITATTNFKSITVTCTPPTSFSYSTTPSCLEIVATPTITPNGGEFIGSQKITLACTTEGATISYTTDDWENSNNYSAPFTITATTTLKVKATKEGMSESEEASATFTKIQALETIQAIFDASATAGNYYVTFNNWVVSGVKGSNAYVTDGTKGFIVYKSGHGFEAGNVISGTAQLALTRYNGAAEFTNLTSTTEGISVATGGTITPTEVSIADLSGVNTGAVITLNNVTYSGSDNIFTDGEGNEITAYNSFMTLPEFNSNRQYNITGVYIQYGGTKEIAPREENDIEEIIPTEPSITVAETLDLPYTESEVETLEVSYENVNFEMLNLYFYDDAGCTIESENDWFDADFTTDGSHNIDYIASENTESTPRTVYMQINYHESELTKVITVTQEAAPQTYNVKLSSNGHVGDSQQVQGSIALSDPTNIPTRFTFAGWTESESDIQFVDNPYTPTSDVTLFAVFSRVEGGIAGSGNYEKVTEAPGDWSGTYLIVFEGDDNHDAVAFDGSLGTLDAVGNGISVSIENGIIAANEELVNSEFTIATLEDEGYSIMNKSGLFIGRTSTSNGLNTSETAIQNSLDFSENVMSISSGGCTLQYNYASNQLRFRYYTSLSQQPIQLYKKDEGTPGTPHYYTRVFQDEYVMDDITIEGPSIITAGSTLNMGTYTLTSEDAANLLIEDGAQLIQNSSNVKATVLKNITGYGAENTQTRDGYYLIANPTATVANDDYDALDGCTAAFDLYTFNPAAAREWVNIGGTSQKVTFDRNVGYLYANAQDMALHFRGYLLPTNGTTDIDLVYYTGGEAGREFPGFNLIGNPYTCNATISGNYTFLKIVGDAILPSTSSVAPCEGIFVEATAAEQSVTFTPALPASQANAPSAMSIEVSQNRGNVIDRAIVRFDGANDLHKFMLNPAHTNISLAKNGEEFAAISTENEGELPVNFHAEKNGTYTITVNTENIDAEYLHLIDNKTGMDVDLLASTGSASYTFEAKTSDYASRFKLVFGVNNTDSESSDSNFAYMSDGNLVIDNIEGQATLQIVDELGRVISTETVNGSYNKALNLKAGLYIINLNGMTQKIVVK